MGARGTTRNLPDEIFDSLFLPQVAEHDDQGQEGADPAMDAFLIMDGHLRFYPTPYIPMEALLELYDGLHDGIDAYNLACTQVEDKVYGLAAPQCSDCTVSRRYIRLAG